MHRKFVIGILAVASVSGTFRLAIAASDHDHGGTAAPARLGDPYPLAVDPLGTDLASVTPIVVLHGQRELRFANRENVEKFKASPAAYLEKLDRALADQQRSRYPLETCIVSGQKLGTMGEPAEVILGNRLVRLCCAGCRTKLEKNAAAHLAALDAAVVRQQKQAYSSKTCPVSGEALGAMGEPVDVVIGHQLARLCCGGCRKGLEKSPALHLQKLAADGGRSGSHPDGGHSHRH